MRLLGKEREDGRLRLGIDTLDDLWTLRNLIRPGDTVEADTYRTTEAPSDKLRAEKQQKKRMRLGVRVETVEWHDFDDHLRVLGTIESGPQDLGRHHTHVFRDEPGTKLTIQKPGRLEAWHMRAVQDAVEATKRPRVILLSLDDTEAQLATLTSYGVQFHGNIRSAGQGKRFDGAAQAKRAYYDEIATALRNLRTDPTTAVLVVGPGWWREEFLDHAAKIAPEAVKGARTDGTAHAGRTGIHEALRRGMLETVAQQHRVAEDTTLVEEVLARIAKSDSTVAYGPDEVAGAVGVGAAETLLVSDERVREGKDDTLLEEAERQRARIHVLASGHDAGAQFAKMGGLAALLRFPYP